MSFPRNARAEIPTGAVLNSGGPKDAVVGFFLNREILQCKRVGGTLENPGSGK